MSVRLFELGYVFVVVRACWCVSVRVWVPLCARVCAYVFVCICAGVESCVFLPVVYVLACLNCIISMSSCNILTPSVGLARLDSIYCAITLMMITI